MAKYQAMKLILFFAVLLSLVIAKGELDVVKVISNHTVANQVFNGSGLPLEFNGNFYVLTSDHVVFHSNNNVHLQILTETGDNLDCLYIASDFASGLALLQIKNPQTNLPWPKLQDLKESLPALNQNIILTGFPAKANGSLRDIDGKLSAVKNSDLFVSHLQILEVSGGHAEFGMSGGPAYDIDGSFVGILSHQVYSEDPGHINNSILIIPAKDSLRWLKTQLTDASLQTITLVQTVNHQLWKNSIMFSTGSLNFTFYDSYSSGIKNFYITPSNPSTAKVFGEINGDLEKYQNHLLSYRKCSLLIMGFRQRDSIHSGIYASNNLVEMLRSFNSTKLEPVTDLSCPGGAQALDFIDSFEENLAKLKLPPSEADLWPLYNELSTLLSLFKNAKSAHGKPIYILVKPKDIENILSEKNFEPAWKTLNKQNKEAELRSFLLELKNQLFYLTI